MTFLKAAAGAAPDRLDALVLPGGAARELETAHRRLLNLHLDKELKSARVLREMRRPGSVSARPTEHLYEWSLCSN